MGGVLDSSAIGRPRASRFCGLGTDKRYSSLFLVLGVCIITVIPVLSASLLHVCRVLNYIWPKQLKGYEHEYTYYVYVCTSVFFFRRQTAIVLNPKSLNRTT